MSKATLAIYGICDRIASNYPFHAHDHNICLMQDGKILNYMQLERYSRRKNDNRLHEFIEEIIDNKVIDLPKEFDMVNVNSFIGNCFISKNGRLRFECSVPDELYVDLLPGYGYFQNNRKEGINLNSYLLNHELAHIATCLPFFGEFKENSLLVHFDGGASLGNFSAFLYKNKQMQRIENHWELSEYSKLFNDNALAFYMMQAKEYEHCSVPGKLMGFASFGQFNEEIAIWMKENNFFKNIWGHPDLFLKSVAKNFNIFLDGIYSENSFVQNCAAIFQSEFESAIFNKLLNLQRKTKAEYLYYSGGCALNISANTKIINSGIFKDVYIPPCCNDSGLSIGGAAFLEWKKNQEIQKHLPYLNNFSLGKTPYVRNLELLNEVAKILIKGNIIGVCNGYAECGPRALGNRSLLALADDKELSAKLSMYVKKREWFRPLAPVMLEKNAKYFTENNDMHHLSKYMLLDFKINKNKTEELQGAIHINGTSRIQTIFEEKDNEFLFDLLSILHENYGIKALINTSFNIGGEPIVQNEFQAIEAAKKLKIEHIILDSKLLNL